MGEARVVLTEAGGTEVHCIDGAPVLHEGRPVVRVVRDGRVGLAPLAEVAETVQLDGGGEVLAARGGEVVGVDPRRVAEVVAAGRAWRAKAREAEARAAREEGVAQRLAGAVLAQRLAEGTAFDVLAEVKPGGELVPAVEVEAQVPPVLGILRAVGLGGAVGAVWLVGGVLGLTPWWEACWWACKACTVALGVAWVVQAAGRSWRSAKAWVPVVGEGGRYSVRVDRQGQAEVLCKLDGRAGWRPLSEFVARPAVAPVPPASAHPARAEVAEGGGR